jgi:hypothetical protein
MENGSYSGHSSVSAVPYFSRAEDGSSAVKEPPNSPDSLFIPHKSLTRTI